MIILFISFLDLVKDRRAGGDEVAGQRVVHVQRPRRRQLHPWRESDTRKIADTEPLVHVVAVVADPTLQHLSNG